ncbi:nucleotidyltransferase family protein [Aliiglaciecola sp. NS0011-25]|uniref:nucleotidyltransferase family protein n=1 Tax=Aliiglaciecola sp. NS0011-25 TaxID=3127654 RepID=UPI003107AA13
MKMKAVLLAAGIGSRLRPLTDTLPKCLVPINGKPLLDFWLEMLLASKQISQICVNLHYLKERVEEHLDLQWQKEPRISLHPEKALLGTAGTLKGLKKILIHNPIMVIHADNLSKFSLNSFIQAHKNRPRSCSMTMMLFQTDTPSSCGIVELSDDGRVVNMHEKIKNPPGNLANGAVYIFEPEILDWIIKHDADDISAQVIPAHLGKIYTWLNDDYHRDIGTPESYRLANSEYIL